MNLRIMLIISFVFFVFTINAQEISIEPPFWWKGMNNAKLQLLCNGENLKSAKVSIDGADVTLQKAHQLDSENYLVLDLEIGSTASDFNIEFEFEDGLRESIVYELLDRDPKASDKKGFSNQDVLYLVTPDRFANGDPSNDSILNYQEGLKRDKEYGRHGGDLKGIDNHLEYIKDLGFSAIWLNPVLENDQDEWSYHGYATTDYYKVDERFGTNDEYRTLSKKARRMGVGMIMDIIVNHCGSYHPWMSDPPSKDWFNYQDDPYQETNHRKETLLDPYKSDIDRKVMTNGWFVPAMPDLNQRNPFVSKYLIQNSIWWIEYADLYGIRQDTYSYPFREFMTDWTCAIMKEYPNFNIVGEEWVDNPAVIAYWQDGKINKDGYTSCLPSLMDFPLCFALHKSLNEDEGWDTGLIRLYQCLSNDFQYASANDLVIFPDNHDMSRVYTQLNEDYDLYKMAIAFILTTRGIPQLYYGTEILMSNKGTDSHGIIRSDFPGGWEGDTISVMEGRNLSAKQLDALEYVKTFLHWRKEKSSIHYGKLTHFIPKDGVYVYFRYNEVEKIMVILNKNNGSYSLSLDRFSEQIKGHHTFYDPFRKVEREIGADLELEGKSALILELK